MKQRFENFRKAYTQFESAVLTHKDLNRLELKGMIKRFEYTFELAWKPCEEHLLSAVTKAVSSYYPAITQVLRYLEGQL